MRRTPRPCSTKTASRVNWTFTTSDRVPAGYFRPGIILDSRPSFFSDVRLTASPSESGAHCKSEGLSRLSKNIGSSVQNLRLLEGVVACGASGEHVARDRGFGRNMGIQDQRVIRVINTERSIHDRQQYLQLHTRGHARRVVCSRNGSQRRGEAKSLLASTVETGVQS